MPIVGPVTRSSTSSLPEDIAACRAMDRRRRSSCANRGLRRSGWFGRLGRVRQLQRVDLDGRHETQCNQFAGLIAESVAVDFLVLLEKLSVIVTTFFFEIVPSGIAARNSKPWPT